MATSKFIKTKSNYVLRNEHQSTSDGKIYERDHMTISGSKGMSPDEIQEYGEGNFKFVVRGGVNEQKKRSTGEWKTESGLTISTTVSKDSKIILNPDYKSLTDFAYYGSAVNLVKSSIVDIIYKFPAELYYTDEEFMTIDGTQYYMISNDYDIDVLTDNIESSEVDNITRYLLVSYSDYIVINTGATVCDRCIGEKPVVEQITGKTCEDLSNGTIIAHITIGGIGVSAITVYQKGETKYLIYSDQSKTGYRIRPKQEVVDDFYDNLPDFERVLLNKTSNPLYTCTLTTIFETEDRGKVQHDVKYTWPSKHLWNPDITTIAYEKYVTALMDLAEVLDNYTTDNIWRIMTHEGIKNLDWTFTRTKNDEVIDFENIDSSKIEPVLKVYGRQYDDLKRYIDNITKSICVTYDKKNNTPDYFLEDTLAMAGWETIAVNPTIDTATVTEILYDGESEGHNSIDANLEFLRRLKVASPYILSKKGTREGIRDILGLFGMEEGTEKDYVIHEYIENATANTLTGTDYSQVCEWNARKYNMPTDTDDPLYGLPLLGILDESGDGYVVPWFDKNKKYDNDLYFQMKGGWGAMDGKYINGGADFISSTAFTMYDESVSEIRYLKKLEDIKSVGSYSCKKNTICYVTNLSDFNSLYKSASGETGTPTHYFILKDDEYYNRIGWVSGTTYGWKCVYEEEFATSGITEDAIRVIQQTTLKESTEGNNPHMGHGDYDSGKSYAETMLNPFKYTYDNDNFPTLSDSSAQCVTASCSFSGTMVEDNKKCWYFIESSTADTSLKKIKTMPSAQTGYITYTTGATGTCEKLTGVTIPSGLTYNREREDGKNEEAAAYSIINIKRLKIEFYPNLQGTTAMRDFVTNKVLFYVKQMIPSTTLFEYTIGNGTNANNMA